MSKIKLIQINWLLWILILIPSIHAKEIGNQAKKELIYDPYQDLSLAPRHFKTSKTGLREIILTWSVPFNNPDKYIIERSISPKGPFVEIKKISPSKGIYKDKGKSKKRFKDNQTFYYRMYAVTDNQKSSYTKVITGKTGEKPEPPTNLQAFANKPREIFLTWDPPLKHDNLTYLIECRNAMELTPFSLIAEIKDKTFFQDSYKNNPQLKDSTEYLYQIRSKNKIKSISPPSQPILIKTMPPPESIKNFHSLSNQIRCVPLKWDISKQQDISYYQINRSLSANGPFMEIARITNIKTDNYLDGKKNPGNLADNKEYYYQIYAINKADAKSPVSPIVKAKTRNLPPDVKNIKASTDQPRQITIKWNQSDDQMVSGYQIYRSTDNKEFKKIMTLKGIDQTQFIDKGDKNKSSDKLGSLKDEKEYYYKIHAYNKGFALSKKAEIIKGFTKKPPSAPKEITAVFDQTLKTAILSWETNPEINKYIIEYAKVKKHNKFHQKKILKKEDDKKLISFQDSKLSLNKKYYYRIKAIDKDGLESNYSEFITINTEKDSESKN